MKLKIKGTELLSNIDTNVDGWLQIKGRSIGSSEIAVLMGLSPFQTPADLYRAKKTGESGVVENRAMRKGKALETHIFNEFLDESKMKGKQPFKMYCDVDHPYATCSPDAFLFDPTLKQFGIGEIKATSSTQFKKWELEPPRYYWAQCQWQMGITGLPWAFLIGECDNKLLYHKILFDEAWYQEALQETSRFFAALETGKAYKGRALEKEKKEKKELVRIKITDNDVYSSEVIPHFLLLKEEKKALDAEVAAIDKEIKAIQQSFYTLLGDHSEGIIETDGGTITVSEVFRDSYIVQATSYKTVKVQANSDEKL